ncbi:MAG: deoxyribodipyrimidine photo-lyase [Pseudohongiellaceae bacterium]|jgi:deoxyribodipyrimidine photo-lyase
MKTLYWVTKELRLDDNPALHKAASSDSLLITYCVDPRWFSPYRYHLASLGTHRWNFLQESLSQFNKALAPLGQSLAIYYERPEVQLINLINALGIERLVCSRQFGVDEKAALRFIAGRFENLVIEQVDTTTLFNKDALPFALEALPPSYSQFRRSLENQAVPAPMDSPIKLPKPPSFNHSRVTRPSWVPAPKATQCQFVGGEQNALTHANNYFSASLPASYKTTRNELDGWDSSSKMSPWLNNGDLSPRRLKQLLTAYETSTVANESTHWLYVELLWREYFQWLALKIGNALFTYKGNSSCQRMGCFYPERFQQWCHGTTPYPLVNACMMQLKQTGYLSNRGRQIAASCFINEMELDWRYGAAWFEHQLVDYDVAVNWGNWQYIAGVGADPRGGRHFNLAKQQLTYDPDGLYQARWPSDQAPLPLNSRDAADWPIG